MRDEPLISRRILKVNSFLGLDPSPILKRSLNKNEKGNEYGFEYQNILKPLADLFLNLFALGLCQVTIIGVVLGRKFRIFKGFQISQGVFLFVMSSPDIL